MFKVKINPIKIIKLIKLGLTAKLFMAIEVINGTNEFDREERMRSIITINMNFLYGEKYLKILLSKARSRNSLSYSSASNPTHTF